MIRRMSRLSLFPLMPTLPILPAAPTEPPSSRRIVLAGALTLAVAMGIGRFAFTPLLL